MEIKQVTTESGAIYTLLFDGTVQGGSKKLEAGKLTNPPVSVGKCMIMLTPERFRLNPHFGTAGVISTPVVEIATFLP